MNLPHFLAASILLGGAVICNARPLLTPATIAKDVQAIGAKQTVKKLTNTKNRDQWERVLAQVESGDARWLAVANVLADGTDAGESEALLVSLAMALPKNPGGVLTIADTKVPFSLTEVCGAPFIEPAPDFYLRYLQETRRALGLIKDAALENKRMRCSAVIEKLLSDELTRRTQQNGPQS